MKHILITGGTGLIGNALCHALLADGNDVTILTRNPTRVRKQFPEKVRLAIRLNDIPSDHHIDQVVNLAGEQIVGKRWTNERKRRIRESRIDLARQLNEFLCGRDRAPSVLVSGSAVGYYGSRGDDQIGEAEPPGDDFGATLCVDWEKVARETASADTRVCLIRTGLVLSTGGGMLEQLLLPFRLGLGARLGSGRQWMSWIHIDDEVAAIRHLLNHDDLDGPFNLTAPEPVTNRVFTKTLAAVLNRPAFLFAPEPLIRLGLGEAAELLVGGQQVVPGRLQDAGYTFRHPTLEQALRSLPGCG